MRALLPRYAVLAASALLAGSAFAGQTRTIVASRQFESAPVGTWSTYSVQPQIQPDPPFQPMDMRAENDVLPWPPAEPRNSMRPGGMLGITRGRHGGAYFPGPTDGRWFPADNQMAVGPTHVVCIINSKIAFYTKAGVKTFETLIDTGANSFFAGVAGTSFVFDPKAFYDPISQRFFVIADDGANQNGISNILLAVSDDNNPNGNWTRYKFNSQVSGSWLDYPGFGFNKDAIIVTGNLFDGSAGGSEILVIKKPALLTGGTAQVSQILDPTSFTIQPTRTTDASVNKIFGVATGGGNAIRFFAFTNLTATPTLNEIDVPVANYSGPPGPAPSGSTVLDTLDGRQMTAAYRNGQVVAAHTIGVGGAIGVRWYDFNVNSWPTSGSPSVRHQGNLTGPSGVAMHMPAININGFEDISIVYTRSSAAVPAQIVESSRVRTDPANQMGQPVVLANSASGSYGGRWGDYFANEIDPVDDATFWGFGMVSGTGGSISTQVVNWIVTAGTTGTTVDADSISTVTGTYLAGDQTSVALSDDLYYQIASEEISRFGQASAAQANFTVPTDTSSISIKLEAISGGIAGGTNMVWLWNWTTSRYDLIASAPLSATGNTSRTLAVRPNDVSKYVGAGGAVQLLVRGHFPIRPFHANPSPFTYQIDQLQLLVR